MNSRLESTDISTGNQVPNQSPQQWTGLDHPFIQFLFYAIIFWIPFYRWRHLSDTSELLKVDWLLAFALGIVVGSYILTRHRLPQRLKTNLNPLFALFLVANIVACLLSPYQSTAFAGLQKIVLGYALIALGLLLFNRQGFTRMFPLVVCWSITLCAVLGVIGFYFQVETLTLGVTTAAGQVARRGVGGSIGANNSALMYIFCMPFLAHWMVYGKNRFQRLAAVAQVIVLLLGLVATYSRGGFLMLLLITAIILFNLRHRFHPRFLGPTMALFCATIIVATLAVPDSFVQRIQTLAEGKEADLAMSRRAAYIEVGMDVFAEHPFLGTGTDTFKINWVNSEMSKRYKGQERYAHNTYLEVLVGSGLVGLILFLTIIFRAFSNYTQAIHLQRLYGNEQMISLILAYRTAFICVIVYLLILSSIEHKLFVLPLALSQVALRLSKETEQQTLQLREESEVGL